MAYLKNLLGTKYVNTKQCQQDYLLELYPIIPSKFLWEKLGIGENPTQQAKVYSFPSEEKSPSSPLINLHLGL